MRLRQKQPRLELNPEEYDVVRKQVLERDNWRCQGCGTMKDLQVHHVKFRSQLGGDVAHNLITLCANCHRNRHGRRRSRILSREV
jgi:5-methylcytosine-specific restriction endonuclease McrA